MDERIGGKEWMDGGGMKGVDGWRGDERSGWMEGG